MTHSRTVFLVVSLLHPAHAPRWSYATGSSCCSVSKSCLTLQPQGLQPARLLCPPLPLGVCSSSCVLSRGCWLTIPFSAAPLSCFQSFPASGSFPIVGSSHQSAKVLELQHQSFPVSIQGWFLSDWLVLLTTINWQDSQIQLEKWCCCLGSISSWETGHLLRETGCEHMNMISSP